ncbi:hypothetical protein G3N56_08450 [Desulfovibrio sulfodismutans]|uniref:Uncharacterized protein n=1 Tax=Desulfolutivibrio sulfodismutans TaxID=63561 RepID=A0A7K3NLQ4_9BACT|nr:hypothetical protein [Desulfolutivibrio sulfodismutans]NDY56773.1 hypothetical protein [Desulfolutivibrio sulfodismutans]QLA13316.1 hypothetical protein GD606_14120 [Desulfolutivibrio sulfodismutans DSM 3696]
MAGMGVRVGEDLAVTQYADWDFHALCREGGTVLAADGRGLCRLCGDTDDGRAIAAALDLPPVALDETAATRVRDIRLRGTCQDGTTILLGVDGGLARRISLGSTKPGGEARIPVGRDGEGRVWTLGVENRDGCGFTLEGLGLGHVRLDRR